jgi:hypothetical protein
MKHSRSLVLLVLLAAPLSAQIHVPGDHPDPQTAVNNASPGQVILVHGGLWTGTGTSPALTIDRAITIVGDPTPVFVPPIDGTGQQPPAIRLAGPGSGSVVLANVHVQGHASGISWSSQAGGIVGGGFSELLVYDSDVRGPEWLVMTGIGAGSSGIDVTVPFVLLSGTTARASDNKDDDCYGFALNGKPGVKSTGTVVALDSIVVGGMHVDPCFPFTGCGPIVNGVGGAGIEAARVDESGSSIVGGPGASWSDLMGAPCGSSTNGQPVDTASHVALPDDLDVTRPTSIGASLTLTWDTPGPVIQIYYSRGASAPYTLLPGLPDAYLRPVNVRLLGTFAAGGGPQSISIPVPPAQLLIGTPFTFQGFDEPDHVTRPISFALGT